MAEDSRNVVMFDIDGCVADAEWRNGLIPAPDAQTPEAWDAYHEHCDRDDPLEKGAIVLKSHIDAGHIILFTTGRPHTVGDKTSNWIQKQFGIDPNKHFSILMRKREDGRPSVELKQEFANFVINNAKSANHAIIAAYDNDPAIVEMYRKCGLNACVLDKDGVQIYEGTTAIPMAETPQPIIGGTHPKRVPDLLFEASQLYSARNALYKDAYKRVGHVYERLFPEGVTLRSAQDFNRFTIVMMLVSKLTRYAGNFEAPMEVGDSLDDLAVYSMMLKEIDQP